MLMAEIARANGPTIIQKSRPKRAGIEVMDSVLTEDPPGPRPARTGPSAACTRASRKGVGGGLVEGGALPAAAAGQKEADEEGVLGRGIAGVDSEHRNVG